MVFKAFYENHVDILDKMPPENSLFCSSSRAEGLQETAEEECREEETPQQEFEQICWRKGVKGAINTNENYQVLFSY